MNKMFKVGMIFMMLLACFLAVPNHASKVYAASTTLTPKADTFVMNGTSADQNFGSANTIGVKNSGTLGRIGYLKFLIIPLTQKQLPMRTFV